MRELREFVRFTIVLVAATFVAAVVGEILAIYISYHLLF